MDDSHQPAFSLFFHSIFRFVNRNAPKRFCRGKTGRWGISVVGIVFWITHISVSWGSTAAPENSSDWSSHGKSTFFPSYQEEHRQMERALSLDIQATLKKLPYIDDARVHLSLPGCGLWRKTDSRPTAAVVVFASEPSRVPKKDIVSIVDGASGDIAANDIHLFIYPAAKLVAATSNGSSHAAPLEKRMLVLLIVVILLGAIGLILVGARRRWGIPRRHGVSGSSAEKVK